METVAETTPAVRIVLVEETHWEPTLNAKGEILWEGWKSKCEREAGKDNFLFCETAQAALEFAQRSKSPQITIVADPTRVSRGELQAKLSKKFRATFLDVTD